MMNRLTLLVVAAAVTLAPQASQAKSVSTTISMNTFKSRCLAAGGTLSDAGAGGVKCRLPSGASVTCYDTDGPGLSCDYRVAGGGVKGLIAGSDGLGSVSTSGGRGSAPSGNQGNGGNSVNPGGGGKGGNSAPGAGSPGGGSMNAGNGGGGGIEG